MHHSRPSVAVLAAAVLATVGLAGAAHAAATQLLRYPYLTDVTGPNATVNWGTDQSVSTGYATYGVAGQESCTAHRANASKTSITVGGTAEYQWKAKITGLAARTAYCYRILFSNPTVDLLGTDPSPQFTTLPAAGSDESFSFAVLGDWGEVDATGANPDQANVLSRIAASDARFVLGTGDTAYPGGSQTNYGDLVQVGSGTSAVFGPSFWKPVGASKPMYNALGNHGLTGTFPMLWPQAATAAASGGRYAMETYCCTNGTTSKSYPSAWYAFDAGRARVYVLDASWSNSNVGTADLYKNDYDNHWTPSSAQYQWLAADLAAHPAALRIAVLHFPFYSDNATETADPYLTAPGSLAELLSRYGTDLVFNGHAHMYQRNVRIGADSFVSYVTGGGGGKVEPIGGHGCSVTDAYGIGWSYSSSKGSRCGAAPVPADRSQVFHFLLVTMQPGTVTVTPTDSLGRIFDVQTYAF
jgi:hypothetical protein